MGPLLLSHLLLSQFSLIDSELSLHEPQKSLFFRPEVIRFLIFCPKSMKRDSYANLFYIGEGRVGEKQQVCFLCDCEGPIVNYW